MVNVNRPTFDETNRPPGRRSRRARLGWQLGTERIGASLWEVPPGAPAYEYHFHYSDEELVLVLSGRLVLRTPDGARTLGEGDLVHFPLGERGAHQLTNSGEEPARFLAVSSHGHPDIVVWPDSGRLGIFERLSRGPGLRAFFRRADAIEYSEGPPRR